MNEDGFEVLRLDVEADVEVLRLDDENEDLLRVDDADVLDADEVFEVIDVVVVVDAVDDVPERVRDDREFVDVCFELEELPPVLTVLDPVRVGLAFADKSADKLKFPLLVFERLLEFGAGWDSLGDGVCVVLDWDWVPAEDGKKDPDSLLGLCELAGLGGKGDDGAGERTF